MKGSRERHVEPVGIRIVGGIYRGRRLRYGGDQRVRPMKDRVREAVFNGLESAGAANPAKVANAENTEGTENIDSTKSTRNIENTENRGNGLDGVYAIDLFAGTGAMGLEALSRGAVFSLFLERHLPTLKIIQENIGELGETQRTKTIFGDTFLISRWWDELPRDRCWCVFCCPPYELFESRTDDLIELLRKLWESAPAGSLFVVESDDLFDMDQLPDAERWRVREYTPAVVAVAAK